MADYDPTDLPSQERERSKLEKNDLYFRQVEEADFKWLMSNRRGRRIVWRLLEEAGVFRTTFTDNPMQTAFNEGMRKYGVAVLVQVHKLTPDLYPTMLTEQQEHARSTTNIRNAAS